MYWKYQMIEDIQYNLIVFLEEVFLEYEKNMVE